MKPHLRPIQRNVLSAYLYTLILVLFSTSVIAQQTTIDSLEHWIKTYPKRDTVYIKKLIELEKKYYVHQPQKIGKYANDILKLSKQSNYFFGVANGYSRLVYYHIQKGDYQVAIKTAFEKLKYVEKSNDYFEIGITYSLLGYIYSLIGNQDENSIKNYRLAYNFKSKLPLSDKRRSRGLAGELSNISLVYSQIGDNEKALSSLIEANKIVQGISNKDNDYYYLLSAIQNNLANTYYKLNNFQLSNYYLGQTLSMAQKYQLNVSLKRIYLSLVRNYIELKQFEKASEYFIQLEKLNEENELDIEDKVLFLKFKTQLKEGEKNFQEAYLSLKEEGILKDSLNKEEQQKAIQELSVKYETEQKESQIRQLQKEKAFSQTQRNYLIAVVALLGVLLIVAFVAIIQVRKSKRKVEEADALRNKLLGIVTHDLRSPVASLRQVSSKVSFVLNKNDKTATQLLTSSIEGAANSLYGLIDNLLHWSLLQQGKVQFQPSKFVLSYELSEVLQTLKYRMTDKSIKLTIDIDDTIEVVTDRMICQTIFRNLLDNAIKFTPEGKSIWVTAEKGIDDVTLLVKDEGEGIPKEMQDNLFVNVTNKNVVGTEGEKGKGIGLNLCYELAQLAGCQLYIAETSTYGTTMALQIPFKK